MRRKDHLSYWGLIRLLRRYERMRPKSSDWGELVGMLFVPWLVEVLGTPEIVIRGGNLLVRCGMRPDVVGWIVWGLFLCLGFFLGGRLELVIRKSFGLPVRFRKDIAVESIRWAGVIALIFFFWFSNIRHSYFEEEFGINGYAFMGLTFWVLVLSTIILAPWFVNLIRRSS